VILANLAGCGRIVISPDDILVAPNHNDATLTAFVERERAFGMRDGIEGQSVDFYWAGRRVGSAIADEEGRARIHVDLSDSSPRQYKVRARVGLSTYQGLGRVYCWTPDAPVIVLDVDKTIAETDYSDLFLTSRDGSEPAAYARDALNRINDDFRFVYLTARPRFLFDKTRSWLDAHGFPDGPLFVSPEIHRREGQKEFKMRALKTLRERCANALIGVGDHPVDAESYLSNGMLALIVVETESEDDLEAEERDVASAARAEHDDPADAQDDEPREKMTEARPEFDDRAILFHDWRDVATFFRDNRDILNDPEMLRRAIAGEVSLRLPGPHGESPSQ
jgi:hypothetical protein